MSRSVVSFLVAISFAVPARAFEADVHYGLTRWLALRAGFAPPQADAIALGDQRLDGGLVDTLRLNLEYGCAGAFADVARLAQHAHDPSATAVPAAPRARIVVPGGEASRVDLGRVMASARGKESAFLGKLGEALHPLQDSWAHQGEPSTPRPGGGVDCDAALVSGHAEARGGAASHAADLTFRWPDDTAAMARATWDALLQYGPVEGRTRAPAAWDALVEPIRAFAGARTKTEKRAWFVAQGLDDTRFLEGTSLPDGPAPGSLDWTWRQLPPIPGEDSRQHDAPADVRAFFDRLLARWLAGEPAERVVADLGPTAPAARDELVARLKAWRLHDHGSAAELAHVVAPMTATQRKAIAQRVRDPAMSLAPTTLAAALLPLQPSTPAPVPMLPYVVERLPDVEGRTRMLAVARLKHAPYDTLGWVAQRQGERWVLIAMVSAVDP